MALLNRPLTEDEARKMLADWRSGKGRHIASFYDMLQEVLREPTPHTVHYYAGGDVLFYTSPEYFHWHKREQDRGPSDCVWIVPGTLERKIKHDKHG